MRVSPPGRRQQGAILVVALMFLVILTLLGISSMTGTTFEERMAGNTRDYNLALQAAEAAIKDAEYDLNGFVMPSPYTPATVRGTLMGKTGFGIAEAAGTCSTTAETKGPGLCLPTAADASPWASSTLNWTDASTNTTVYGKYTGADNAAINVKGVSQQPRYIITAFQRWTPSDNPPPFFYEMTARGFGANSNTKVTLQTFFRPKYQ